MDGEQEMSGGNPLDDPRCAELLGADPGHISDVASMLEMVAHNCEICIQGTRVVQQANWTGAAFQATVSSINSLIPGLRYMGGAYRDAARALTTYANVVSTEQPIFKSLKQQLESAQSNVNRLTTQQSSQAETYKDAQTYQSEHPDLKGKALTRMNNGLSTDSSDLTSTTNSLNAANSLLSGLQFQGMNILETFSTARHTAATAIRALGDAAPQESWAEKDLSAAGHFFMAPVHFVEGIAVGTFDAFKNLPEATIKMWDDPNLKNIENFADDAGTVFGTLAMATGVGEVFATAKGLDTLAEGAGAVTKGYEGTAAALSVTSAVAAGIQGKWGVATKDLALVALPASKGMENAEKSADDVLEARKAYAGSLSDGDTPGEAFARLTPKQQGMFEIEPGVAAVPITLGAAQKMVQTGEADLAKAKSNVALKGAPADKVEEGIGDKVAPSDPGDKKPKAKITPNTAGLAPALAN